MGHGWLRGAHSFCPAILRQHDTVTRGAVSVDALTGQHTLVKASRARARVLAIILIRTTDTGEYGPHPCLQERYSVIRSEELHRQAEIEQVYHYRGEHEQRQAH
jgi:hypothetical protein